jgi:hypothetical protein
MKRIVHIVGTGTIGEPLIGLFTDFRDRMDIDEVTFHKRTPLASDKARINHLMERGAKLAWREPPWSSTAPRRGTRTKSSSTRRSAVRGAIWRKAVSPQ